MTLQSEQRGTVTAETEEGDPMRQKGRKASRGPNRLRGPELAAVLTALAAIAGALAGLAAAVAKILEIVGRW